MRTCIAILWLNLSVLLSAAANFEALNPEAERLYAERSFAKAHELFAKTDLGPLNAEARRWIAFRKADTAWRAAIEKGDDTMEPVLKSAANDLQELIRGRDRREDQDRVWAEANESLGMMPHTGEDNWRALERALNWWASSRDIDLARDRYLRIVKTIFASDYQLQQFAGTDLLENAARIAVTDEDKAWSQYRLAVQITNRGQPLEFDRARAAFEAAIAIGKKSQWYDDALGAYAQWLMHSGRIVWHENGSPMPKPDRKKALDIFRKITAEFGERETPFYRQARLQIDRITQAQLTLNAESIFAPGASVDLNLHFQNVRQVEFTLRKVDLIRDFKMWEERRSGSWGEAFGGADGEVIRRWTRDFSAKEEFENHHERIEIEDKLSAGTYVLEVTGAGKTAREMIGVSDLALVVKSASNKTILYVCDAQKGAPIANADVKLWIMWRNGDRVWNTQRSAKTDANGLAEFDAENEAKDSIQAMVALAQEDGRPAFAMPWPVRSREHSGREWRIYGVTDRPAYRPGETAYWKITARRTQDGVYSTPVGAKLRYEIHDARRNKVKEGEVTLNSFGSAWGEFELTAEMALGVFHIQIYEGNDHIATAGNFRLEEYKLPEFKVAVNTPMENGRAKAFRLGEKVDVAVRAEYYFGGAVADAAVKVIVRKQPLYHVFPMEREFPWFYAENDSMRRRWRGQEGEVLFEKDLRTDADGQATFSIETANFGGEDLEFTIEARVTDASRREIIGNGSVKVTRHRYRVNVRAAHWLHRPGDKVSVGFTARDANENPIAAEGKVSVTRETWSKDRRRYESELFSTATVKTDEEGKGSYDFTPQKEGYYRVVWVSETDGKNGPPIRAEETVWVVTNRSTELGYRRGALEILVDKDTFRVGQKAPVMIHTPEADRWVLLTIGTDRIFRRELLHLEGTIKLLELDLGDEHVPNFFIDAVMVSDGQLHVDQKEVVVPPTKNFLTVEVKPSRAEFRVREDGEYLITTKDHEGKPVSAEVSFGVVDESVFYIAQDGAMDPRQFFFGSRRYRSIQTASTFQMRAYKSKEGKKAEAFYDSEAREEMASDRAFAGGRTAAMPRPAARAKSMSFDAAETGVSLGAAVLADAANAPAAPPGEEGPEPLVRSDFRSTVFWQPDVKTDEDGTARVKATFPDSTTGWKGTARAANSGNQFGIGHETVRTTQPLIVRLQAPRFFVVGDRVTVSAVINNNTSDEISATPQIEIKGLVLAEKTKMAAVKVPANGEARVDWTAIAETHGEAAIKVTARSSDASDAMERKYPVYEHGIEKFVSASGILATNSASITVEIPAARKPGSTKLIVQATPSLAVRMLDALPYLIDYPYGCVEQTMSRFLPATIVARTLREAGLDPEDVMNRTFGGIEAAHVGKTQPKGKKNMQKLDEMVAAGLDRLAQMRHGDGGWGWWAQGDSDPWMTAYVVWGLALARDAGREIPGGLLEGGIEFLRNRVLEAEASPDAQAWQLHALSVARPKGEALGASESKALHNLWAKRESLNAYSRALFALAAHHLGDKEKAATLIRNLENSVIRDVGTAHWGKTRNWWRWSESGVESTAFALRALMTIDPKNALIEPTANWLIKNRRGAQWSNTRDTAMVILAMTDYLKASGELEAEVEYEIFVNGSSIASRKVSGADVFAAPSRFEIAADKIRDGANEIRVARKGGSSRVYFGAEATFFSLEEPITPAANEIFARRQYFRLVPQDTLLKGKDYERVLLKDGEEVKSGDRIEVALLIEAKNDYEYLVFEDLKPGGFEAVEIRSGEAAYARQVRSNSATRVLFENDDYTGDSRWVNKEMRDRKVASFIDKLPQGFWELRYEFRAEAPGKFHALPVIGYAMYVPEIRCNSAEQIVTVAD